MSVPLDFPAPRFSQLYRPAQVAIDTLLLAAGFVGAYLLRFDFSSADALSHGLLWQLPTVVLVQLVCLEVSGVRARSWRYTGLGDIRPLLYAATMSTTLVVTVRLLPATTLPSLKVPLSVAIIDSVLGFGALLCARVIRRSVSERRRDTSVGGAASRTRVLLIGAGRAGVLAARELRRHADGPIEPVCFVDDDPLKQGSIIGGLRVAGTSGDLARLAREHGISQAVLTIADATPQQKRQILHRCTDAGLAVRQIPGLYELLQGRVSVSQLRDVRPEELLGRAPVELDRPQLERWVAGRRILVSGAGGSIGSELARQLVDHRTTEVLLVDRSEFALFEIDRELRAVAQVTPILADIRDEERIRRIISVHRPDLIVHAAAHKHVPMIEAHPTEAITNNVQGTEILGRVAGECGVPGFVLVSTDKAVNPTSVMGASKRVAELVVQDLNRQHATRYCAVRFGNVLGSSGSVVPVFRDQIKRGGPVTITDLEMRRYFMSIPEAAQLVLLAGSMAQGGEIFVLDMGEPVRILDLAENLIRLSGYEPYSEIPIEIIGAREGEKLVEELGTADDELDRTQHPKIFVGRLRQQAARPLRASLTDLFERARSGDGAGVRDALATLLPEADLLDSSVPVVRAVPDVQGG